MNYKEIFSTVLYEEMGRVFAERHIDVITEDELDDIVAECFRRVYYQSIAEFKRLTGQASTGTEWRPRASKIGSGLHGHFQ